MNIRSLFRGLPREHQKEGKKVFTGIYKTEVPEAVQVGPSGLHGDGQGDPKVHGGIDKAVYSYALEHYAFWKTERPDFPWSPGFFGENVLTEGLEESRIRIGDRFRFGEALLEARQPRLPCQTLAFKFGDPWIVKAFFRARRFGIYFRVLEPGVFSPGSEIRAEDLKSSGPAVFDLARLHQGDRSPELLDALAGVSDLPEYWREKLRSAQN